MAAGLMLAACSLYQSPGRKSLENSGFDIANGTASLVGCERSATRNGDVLRDDTMAQFFGNGTWISVVLKESPAFGCDYEVTSQEAASTHLDELLTYTVSQQKNH